MRKEGRKDKCRQTLQQVIVGIVVWSHDEQPRVEVARIHIDGTKMTTVKQRVDVVEKDVVGIHVNHTVIVKHVPHIQLV